MTDINNLTAQFEISITDLEGNVVSTQSASATCARIQVEIE
jgi:hypothetical protein